MLFRSAVHSFSQWPVMGTVLLLLMGSYVTLGIHDLIAFVGLPRPVCSFHTLVSLLLTSLGFPGPITLSLSLGFMGLP